MFYSKEVFALKLLFFEIFLRGKISQKILMKKKLEMQKNAYKLNAIFIFLDAKLCKYFFIFLKFRLSFQIFTFAFFLKRSVRVFQKKHQSSKHGKKLYP